MWTRQRRARPIGRATLVIATAAICGYFAHHSVGGQHGWVARAERIAERQALGDEIARLAATRASMEARTSLLNGTVIERDVLDERARDLLGVARADEIVVLLPDG